MKKWLIFFSLLMISVVFAGDLRVNIINGTRNARGQADQVTLMDLSAGMTAIASSTNVDGSITFSDIKSGGQSQYLIQVQFEGVTYSGSFVPSIDVSAWETSVTVYERSEQVSEIIISIPYFAIYASEDQLYIQKRLVIENLSDPPVTYMKSPGVINIHIPEDITKLDYLTFKSGSMPLRTQLLDSEKGQVLPNPIKPGISEVDIAYYLPYDPNSTTISETVDYDIDHFHVYTMPSSLHIHADGLTGEGSETANGWATYAIDQVKRGTTLEFQISGAGISEAQIQTQQNRARILVEHRLPVSTKLVLSGVLIMLILLALFISITQQSADLKQESINMLQEQQKLLLKQYIDLQGSSADQAAQDKILHQLYSVYKTLDRIQ